MSSKKITSDKMGVASFNTNTVKMKVNFRTSEGGTGGTGIANLVQTTESTEDGGINVWTATMTDGSSREFHVRNGSKGSPGEGGGGSVTVDSELDPTSEHPLQNKAICAALNGKASTSAIPTKTSELTNDSGFITSADVPSSSSNFIGTFASVNELPQSGVSAGNYAYVGSSAPYLIYSYNGTTWSATGATVDTNNLTADEEDITASETWVLSLKNRNTDSSSKGYVRVRKNLVSTLVPKTYSDVTWVHTVESTARSLSTATDASSYDSTAEYFEGNPAPYIEPSGSDAGNPNGHDHYSVVGSGTSGFPFAGNKSVRESAPCITLNTNDNKVYFKWQYYTGKWAFSDIYYDEWYESDADFSIEAGTAKTFGYVVNGVTHYVHWDGSAWETDAKEQATINSYPNGTFGTQNTIYDILYDIDLNGATIKPASGVVLRYSGGKIKNGAIDFRNGNVIIDCGDVQFFENVTIIGATSQIIKDVWFDDVWMAMSGDTSFPCTRLNLSKNHTVDFKHGEITVADTYNRKLIIYGNGYQLKIDNSYRPSGGQLFTCSAVEIHDLNIAVTNEDWQTYNAIFQVADVFMRNVTYRGYSRFAANWAQNSYSKSALILYDCDLRSTAFLFEDYFNKVRFYNCQLRYLNPIVRQNYELISIGSYVSPAAVDDCNVEAYNTYIGGVWELRSGAGLDSNGDITHSSGSMVSYYNYGYMKFHNCELVRFTTNHAGKKRGNTDITYEDCHFTTCNLPWKTSAISTVVYKNCWFDIFGGQVGATTAGPFNFWNIKSAKFEGCTFNNTSFADPEAATTYPPLRSVAMITIAPPADIVSSGTSADVELTSDWDFKLYLLGNRIMVNGDILEGYSYRPYSHFPIRTVNPNGSATGYKVTLTDAQAKNLIVSRGNAFVHSVSGVSGYFQDSVGCHAYLNSRENVIPVDNTVFSVAPTTTASTDMDYSQANFGYCGTSFTFIDASLSVPRYGRYNAATNKVAWLTYSAEEDVPNASAT